MAVSWGSWQYGGGNGMRVGLDVSVASVSSGSSSVKFTIKVWTDNQYGYNDPQQLNYSGAIGGSTSFTNNCYGCKSQRATKTYTYNYGNNEYGSSPGKRTFTAKISGAYNGVTPSKSVTKSIPARPYASPNAPSGCSATRNSDSQATVTWSRNQTSQRPYTSQTVQMRTYDGAWSGWSTVANASATATSFVKTGLSSNRAYQFQVRANNSVGSSGWCGPTSTIYTSPAPPANVKAARQAGTDIKLTWTDNVVYSTPATFEIQRSVDGGAFTEVAVVAGTTWTDPAPGAGTNVYRIRCRGTGGATGLYSGWVTSNTVTVAVPPLAPVNLSPNGVKVDMEFADVTLSWEHVPGADNADQSAALIEWSEDGGQTWDTLTTVLGDSPTYTIEAGTFPNGPTYLWRVSTIGSTTAGYGPPSLAATIQAVTAPVVTLDPAAPEPETTALPLRVAWVYNQDQGSPQVGWQAEVRNDAGAVLDQRTGTTETETSFDDLDMVEGVTYTVCVRVLSGDTLWSDWTCADTSIVLLPPATPLIGAVYDACNGAATLSLSSEVPQSGVTLPVESVRVERRIAPEGEWTVIAAAIEVPTDIVDPLPAVAGTTEYRAVAVSSVESTQESAVATLTTDPDEHQGWWALLSYGPAFSTTLRAQSGVEVKETASRLSQTQHFLGRTFPVALYGRNADRVVSVSGLLHYDTTCRREDECRYDSPPQAWLDAGESAGVVAFRDWTGRRMFGLLGPVEVDGEAVRGNAPFSFTVTKVDYSEPVAYPKEYVYVDLTPLDVLSDPLLWQALGYGYALPQSAPTAEPDDGGMTFAWNAAPDTDPDANAMQGVSVPMQASEVYRGSMSVQAPSGAARWRLSAGGYAVSAWVTPDGDEQTVELLWDATVTAGVFWGIEVEAGDWPNAGTHTVTVLTIERREG